MTEPSDQPGADIRADDKVTHRETGGTGHVEGVLPVYGGFGAAPVLSGEHAVLFVLAVVRAHSARTRYAPGRTWPSRPSSSWR